jgi:hypothetical protein
MAAFSQASQMSKGEKEFPCAPPPSPITSSRRNFDLSVSPLSSSPDESFKDDDMDMSDSLVMALSRMNVEQSSLKRKKHSEHEFSSSGYEGENMFVQGQKKAKCKRKHTQSSGINSQSHIQKLVSVDSVKGSISVPST